MHYCVNRICGEVIHKSLKPEIYTYTHTVMQDVKYCIESYNDSMISHHVHTYLKQYYPGTTYLETLIFRPLNLALPTSVGRPSQPRMSPNQNVIGPSYTSQTQQQSSIDEHTSSTPPSSGFLGKPTTTKDCNFRILHFST